MARRHALVALIVLIAVVCAVAAMPVLMPGLRQHRQVVKAFRAWMAGAEYVGDRGVVLQPRRYDCAAACLKTVLAMHGIDRELDVLEKEARTSLRGASLADVRRAAEAEGLPARGWYLTKDDLQRAPLPAIAFVKGDHYVVIRRYVSRDVLEVDDPALGRLHWPLRTFSGAWRGETLIFNPSWDPHSS